MKAPTSLVTIVLAAASLSACVGTEIDDDMGYEEEPDAQLETDPSEAEFKADASASPLSSWDEQMYTDDDNPGGRVRFETIGDIVEVCDIQADGKAVDLYYNGLRVHVGGKGNCVTLRASMGSAYDLVEGEWYRFEICLNGGEWCDEAGWRNNNR